MVQIKCPKKAIWVQKKGIALQDRVGTASPQVGRQPRACHHNSMDSWKLCWSVVGWERGWQRQTPKKKNLIFLPKTRTGHQTSAVGEVEKQILEQRPSDLQPTDEEDIKTCSDWKQSTKIRRNSCPASSSAQLLLLSSGGGVRPGNGAGHKYGLGRARFANQMFWGRREHKREGTNPLQREIFPPCAPPGLHPHLTRPPKQSRVLCLGLFWPFFGRASSSQHFSSSPSSSFPWMKAEILPSQTQTHGPQARNLRVTHNLNHIQHTKSTKNHISHLRLHFSPLHLPSFVLNLQKKTGFVPFFVFSELPASCSFSAASGQALGKPKPGALGWASRLILKPQIQ